MGASSSVQGGGGRGADEDEYRRSYGRRFGRREAPPAQQPEGEEGAHHRQDEEGEGEGERGEVGDESRDTDRRIAVSDRGGAMARGLFDHGDLDPSDLSPSIQELQKHMTAMRSAQRDKFARGVLLFANTVSLVFACVLIYYGCAHSTDLDLSRPGEAMQAVGGELWDLGESAIEEAQDYLQVRKRNANHTHTRAHTHTHTHTRTRARTEALPPFRSSIPSSVPSEPESVCVRRQRIKKRK